MDPIPALIFKFLVILETLWNKSKDQVGSIWIFWLLAHHYISWSTLMSLISTYFSNSAKKKKHNESFCAISKQNNSRVKSHEIQFLFYGEIMSTFSIFHVLKNNNDAATNLTCRIVHKAKKNVCADDCHFLGNLLKQVCKLCNVRSAAFSSGIVDEI